MHLAMHRLRNKERHQMTTPMQEVAPRQHHANMVPLHIRNENETTWTRAWVPLLPQQPDSRSLYATILIMSDSGITRGCATRAVQVALRRRRIYQSVAERAQVLDHRTFFQLPSSSTHQVGTAKARSRYLLCMSFSNRMSRCDLRLRKRTRRRLACHKVIRRVGNCRCQYPNVHSRRLRLKLSTRICSSDQTCSKLGTGQSPKLQSKRLARINRPHLSDAPRSTRSQTPTCLRAPSPHCRLPSKSRRYRKSITRSCPGAVQHWGRQACSGD